jgi:hypothetical protein
MPEIPPTRIERPVLMRVVFGVLWFIPFYLAINMTVGAIVGATAGSGVEGFDAGYSAGQAAGQAFFARYGALLLLAEVALTAGLSVSGVLPGTGKWKKG